MSQVTIEKVRENQIEDSARSQKQQSIAQRIRKRAYEIFEHRDRGGEAVDDWLQAERDLILAPDSELVERDGKYEIRVAAPGFKAGETTVTVFPDAVTVSAESHHEHSRSDGDVHFCEFGRKALYRRINLPNQINEDRVTARLEDGILRITAQKAERVVVQEKNVQEENVHASAA